MSNPLWWLCRETLNKYVMYKHEEKYKTIPNFLLLSFCHCFSDVSVIIKVDYFIPFCCCPDDILTARILSIGQSGLLTMIYTTILAIFMRKKIFENVETSLFSLGFVSRAMWNTNDDRYFNFGHFL